MVEIWKDVQGYEGLYQVSSFGRVKRILKTKPNRILTPSCDKDGYKRLSLCKENKARTFSVHRLVAVSFIPNPNNYPVINHKDENKGNNNADNLEWCTVQYNTRYKDVHIRKSRYLCKPILQFSLNGAFIRKWESQVEIEKVFKKSHRNISACCNGHKGRRTAYGYIWKFA